jgi:hypothetical protein
MIVGMNVKYPLNQNLTDLSIAVSASKKINRKNLEIDIPETTDILGTDIPETIDPLATEIPDLKENQKCI